MRWFKSRGFRNSPSLSTDPAPAQVWQDSRIFRECLQNPTEGRPRSPSEPTLHIKLEEKVPVQPQAHGRSNAKQSRTNSQAAIRLWTLVWSRQPSCKAKWQNSLSDSPTWHWNNRGKIHVCIRFWRLTQCLRHKCCEEYDCPRHGALSLPTPRAVKKPQERLQENPVPSSNTKQHVVSLSDSRADC